MTEKIFEEKAKAQTLRDLVDRWRAISYEKKGHHNMSQNPSLVMLPAHSERRIFTLRQCAHELEEALNNLASDLEGSSDAGRL